MPSTLILALRVFRPSAGSANYLLLSLYSKKLLYLFLPQSPNMVVTKYYSNLLTNRITNVLSKRHEADFDTK